MRVVDVQIDRRAPRLAGVPNFLRPVRSGDDSLEVGAEQLAIAPASNGLGREGELEIVEGHAKIVRRIFEEFAQGYTARDIAGRLNGDGVDPPHGIRWNASTIYGSVQRGNGILLNEIYVGQIVWNKVRMVKDPETGKRISRPNPSTQHKRTAAPHLRIVDEGTWTAVQAKRRIIPHTKPKHRIARF